MDFKKIDISFHVIHRRFLVAAFKAFLAQNPTAPLNAPNPKAFPPAMSAGMSAAKGNIPPFCPLFLPLLFVLRPLLRVCLLRLAIYVVAFIMAEIKAINNATNCFCTLLFRLLGLFALPLTDTMHRFLAWACL